VIRVALAGRYRVVLDSLTNLITAESDLNVLGEFGEDGSIPAVTMRPDIALFDLDDANDDRVFERLQKTAAGVRTIVMSISTSASVAFRVFQAGAMGLVSKRQPAHLLLTAIRRVHAGEAWLGRAMASHVLELARANRRMKQKVTKIGSMALTPRDRRMIALVGEGWRNADIARHLLTSEATVRASLTSIFQKLGVPDRFALMIYASQHGYVDTRERPRRPSEIC
jgi:two-component system, NarL family, nitrate/nitrite response regulator NarL